MTDLIPDPERPDTYIVGNVTDQFVGASMGAMVISNVHSPNKCMGEVCIIHSPTDHHMRSWPLTYRMDKGVWERTCKHGIGHTDPDCMPFLISIGHEANGTHGCDRCCRQ